MMKKWRIPVLLACAFFVGFIFSFLIYLGYWYRFIEGIKSLRWYMYPLWLILTFFITLTIHELGHLVMMVLQGVKIRALYIYVMIIYRSQKGWRIKIKPKLWFFLGGFVVPDLGEIKDDETYDLIIKRFAKSLMAGPIVTISFLCLSIMIFFLSIIGDWQRATIGHLTLFTFFTILFSWFYIKSFKLSNPSFYGDFVAYHKMIGDPVFQIVEINQYISFSLKESKETESYLFNRTKKILLDHSLNTSLFHQLALLSYIEGVCYNGYQDDETIRQKIMKYPIAPNYRTEQGITLLYDIALYYYHLGWVEKSYQLIEEISHKANPKIDEKMRLYLEKKHKHILHLQYDEVFLSKKENYIFRMSGLFEDLLDMEEITRIMHEKRPFMIWKTDVDLTFKEENSDSN